MTLLIIGNQYALNVVNDLRKIAPDPFFNIDIGIIGGQVSTEAQDEGFSSSVNVYGGGQVTYSGQVTYGATNQSPSDFGSNLVFQLMNSTVPIAIRGENSNYNVRDPTKPQLTMGDRAGIITFDTRFTKIPTLIEIVYDATNFGGGGYWVVEKATGKATSMPTTCILIHELGHAMLGLSGSIFTRIWRQVESSVIADFENPHRAQTGLPARDPENHSGGHGSPPMNMAPISTPAGNTGTTNKGGGCWWTNPR